MQKHGLRVLLLLGFLYVLIGGSPVSAQNTTNLLVNGGLEEGSFGKYTGRRSGEFPIYLAGSWNYWLAPAYGDRYNRAERTSIQPHPGPLPTPREGQRALSVDCGYFSCTAAIYQTVGNLQPKTNVRLTAWSQLKACDLPKGSSGCGSAIESGAQVRVGIDPAGGTDPNNPAIVWSNWIQPHEQNGWQQVAVDATVTGNAVTAFLFSTQKNFADINKTYWDDVALLVGGGGGASAAAATAVPTPVPVVAFVVPQAPQPDGSIIHTIGTGDTIDSIAFAYGVTRNDILQLNNLQSANFIFVGQRLIVKPAPQATAETTDQATQASAPATLESTQAAGGAGGQDQVAVLLQTISALQAQATQNAAQGTAPTKPATTQEAAAAPTQLPPTAIVPPPTQVQAAQEPTQAQQVAAVPTQPINTAAPAPVVTSVANAVNPAAATATVCVLMFNDANQNRIQEQGEEALPGGKVTLNTGGKDTGSHDTTNAIEPFCFESLSAGDYVALASAPNGFGLTTPNQFRLQLNPGAKINIAFGAAQGVQSAAPPPADSGGLVSQNVSNQGQSSTSLVDQLLSISGLIVLGLAALVLIGGLGLALLLRRR
jgi:LysM repeat protein